MSQRRIENKQEFSVVKEESAVNTVAIPAQQSDIPVSFDHWWLQTQSKYKFKPELKKAVQKHFESRGFVDYKKFNEGLRDFGFKV